MRGKAASRAKDKKVATDLRSDETGQGELVFIRHAPVLEGGYLVGRTDVSARINNADIARLNENLPTISQVVTSPAIRCVETANALWPGQDLHEDERLWEQDFGRQEGVRFESLPDIGVKSNDELLTYRPEGGESFDDLCTRCSVAIKHWSGQANAEGRRIALVAHAGTIRAALGMALGNRAAALSIEIDNLSMTWLRAGPTGPVSIRGVNLP